MPPPPISPQQQAFNDAKEHLAAGRNDAAIQQASTLIPEKKANNFTAEALSIRAQAYVAKGNSAKAVEDFSKSISLNPYNEWTFAHRGKVYAKKKMYDQAIQDYTNAICIKPEFAVAWCNRAQAYLHLGLVSTAEYECTKAIACDPLFAPAFTHRGEIRNMLGNYEAAAADLQQALSWEPEKVESMYHLAYSHFCLGALEEALDFGNKTVELDPNYEPGARLVADIASGAKHSYPSFPPRHVQ